MAPVGGRGPWVTVALPCPFWEISNFVGRLNGYDKASGGHKPVLLNLFSYIHPPSGRKLFLQLLNISTKKYHAYAMYSLSFTYYISTANITNLPYAGSSLPYVIRQAGIQDLIGAHVVSGRLTRITPAKAKGKKRRRGVSGGLRKKFGH